MKPSHSFAGTCEDVALIEPAARFHVCCAGCHAPSLAQLPWEKEPRRLIPVVHCGLRFLVCCHKELVLEQARKIDMRRMIAEGDL